MNRGADEATFEKYNYKFDKLKDHWAAAQYCRPKDFGNVPNFKHTSLDNTLYSNTTENWFNRYYKWNSNKHSDDIRENIRENIQMIINKPFIYGNELTFLKATLKQYERRGNIGYFYGHRDNYFEDDNLIV